MGLKAASQDVLSARQQFLRERVAPSELVAKSILNSWIRCAGLGLEMTARPRVEPMTSNALRELRECHESLRRICRPEIEALRAEAAATDSIIVLTDARGMILETLGSADFASRAQRVALSPGVLWSESSTGTNAIGTAIVERRPIEVHGSEHFFEPHRILNCSAAPILDPQGEIVGVLDLSGHASVHPLHALGLVRFAVDQIEHRFFENGFQCCDLLRFHTDPTQLGTPREGIFVFDNHRLVGANRHGLNLLGLGIDILNQRRFGDLFTNGLGRLEAHCKLRSYRGDNLYGRLRRPVERVASTPKRSVGHSQAAAAPWLDEQTLMSRSQAVRLVNADVPVLLQGETGVGKEIFAREIHAHSARSRKPFVAINCAALPESLIESELFGYEEGAFTGARRQGATGLLRQVDGGILFLDEIGDMPPGLQARLLRVLQEREVMPLGSGRAFPVDFAVVCATHRNLRDLIAGGTFRADLYFRIAQYTVELPSVRSIPNRAEMIRSLWDQLGATNAGVALTHESEDLLAAYHWPGNFRQLIGTLRTLMILADRGSPLTPERLPGEIRDVQPPAVAAQRPQSSEIKRLDHITKQSMRVALDVCGGNVSKAAKQLGINRSTLYRRMINVAKGA